ncbi:nucleoid-structuring protein H-NS [bacterium B17]|nr:nucleoid-structuring protein H-NS [bacterium B17]
MTDKNENKSSSDWISYRPDIKILDCTIRDGGLVNNHQFEMSFAKRMYETCVAAGVDYVEFGYKGDKKIFSQDEYGAWKFSDEDDLREVVGDNPTDIKISVMADAERTDYHNDILPRDQSVIDCIRVACYIHQIPLAMDMVKDATDKGYETMFQLMAVSTIHESDIKSALEVIATSEAEAVYIVDSFGSLYSEQIRNLTKMYVDAMEGTGKEVGFHGHNNQQLAFANTIEALISGASRVDGTISGIGRGAGNCPLELLLGFLHNPKFSLRPVIETCRDVFTPMSKEMDWGYSIPYAITGQLNQHPRAAIKWRAGDAPDDYVSFYDQLEEE